MVILYINALCFFVWLHEHVFSLPEWLYIFTFSKDKLLEDETVPSRVSSRLSSFLRPFTGRSLAFIFPHLPASYFSLPFVSHFFISPPSLPPRPPSPSFPPFLHLFISRCGFPSLAFPLTPGKPLAAANQIWPYRRQITRAPSDWSVCWLWFLVFAAPYTTLSRVSQAAERLWRVWL